ncbi:MAG: hypothetical protein CVV13_06315 [Gammaproteobacteria bacterium HGW-Gammaproteobacteria-3]|nr:MAG: hypothetical protein CVV13_06315 [Gammaproteobacteria bacterium HGW-Gammaproteobacteria-3]
MKQLLFSTLLLTCAIAFADDAKNEWHNTTLSDATIKKIQASRYQYHKCIAREMQAAAALKQDIRSGTEAIVKKCENELAVIRKVYIEEKVPAVIADRHLKQLRLQSTRNVLKQMMFAEAARKANQQ